MLIYFVLFVLYLLSGSAFFAIFCNLRSEITLGGYLLLQGLGYYFFTLLNLESEFFIISCVISVLLWVFAIIKGRKNLTQWYNFFTPALVTFIVFVTWLFLHQGGRTFTQWDEFSHWGGAAKLFHEQGVLPYQAGDVLLFGNYPPMAALWCSFVLKFFGMKQFSEWISLFAMGILTLGVLLPLLLGCNFKKPIDWLLRATLLYVISLVFFPDFCTMYVDALLAAVLAYGMILLLYFERFKFAMWLLFCGAVGFLFPLKQSGFGLGIFLLGFAWCRIIFNPAWRREYCNYLGFVATLGVFLVGKIWWEQLVDKSAIVERFSGENIAILQIFKDIGTNTNFSQHINNVLNEVFLTPQYSSLSLPFGVFILLLWLLSWRLIKLQNKTDKLRLTAILWIIPILSSLFVLSLSIYYFYEFSALAITKLASFERYTATVSMSLSVVCLTMF